MQGQHAPRGYGVSSSWWGQMHSAFWGWGCILLSQQRQWRCGVCKASLGPGEDFQDKECRLCSTHNRETLAW